MWHRRVSLKRSPQRNNHDVEEETRGFISFGVALTNISVYLAGCNCATTNTLVWTGARLTA